MDKEFWIQRWQENDIGFHQDEINPHLQAWWQRLDLVPGSEVFVPLCGKSRDLIWLLEQGYEVIGVEASSLAIESFFSENDLTPEVTERGSFKSYTCDGLEILCGDFFSITAQHLDRVSGVFDRAALVALPPELRKRYVQHLIETLPEKIQILLLTIEYDQQEMQGPPFAVMEEEIHQLYTRYFRIQRLDKRDMLKQSPRFIERGVSRMVEKVFWLSR